MEVTRSEVLKVVKKKDPLYTVIDDLAYRAKNVYNSALYLCRQLYENTGYTYNYYELYKLYNENCESYGLPTQTYQQILRDVVTVTSSFKKAEKEYYNNPAKFLGRPQFPIIIISYKNQ